MKFMKINSVEFHPGKYKVIVGDFGIWESAMFERWLKSYGREHFEKWYEGQQRLKGTKCECCDWKDPMNAQCFDGHIQSVGCPKQEGKNEV